MLFTQFDHVRYIYIYIYLNIFILGEICGFSHGFASIGLSTASTAAEKTPDGSTGWVENIGPTFTETKGNYFTKCWINKAWWNPMNLD